MAEALFDALPHGWQKRVCPVKPGIHHDDLLTGAEREIVTPSGRVMYEVEHECRKCGARCRWVKLNG